MSGNDTQTPGFCCDEIKALALVVNCGLLSGTQQTGPAGAETILQHTASRLLNTPNPECMNGRRVVVVDGTGVSMPDTIANQLVWPQQRHQKAGCGFPQAAICACFCLQTGTLLSHKVGNKKNHELPLLREQWDTFKPGDIFLGDKGFCSYYDLSSFKDRGVDSVITLARRIPVTEVDAEVSVNQLGFRTQGFYIITTLLNEKAYTA